MTITSTDIISKLQQEEGLQGWQQLLEDVISAFGCSTGTIHTLDKNTGMLALQAYQGIPDFLLPKMQAIPIGKGMAGIAAERKQPVEMCNLQTDNSGVARPAAKETKVEGSIAAPMMLEGQLYGTLGIAKPVPYDFTEEEKAHLMQIGELISGKLKKQQAAEQR
ncbi:GAF domain-containing protein [Pontibacter mangrovi]|uniref:GAF domain-containing protein n=1 Tax=Pontibacter mangrovi TaxID=2589816 RepID=A0A501WBT8_9BACT|nr:GAF domain-containing protein [Pontibacter mangrovi]TPE46272.1 GAF domain-containing protein [Pontibacter mangrovi]